MVAALLVSVAACKSFEGSAPPVLDAGSDASVSTEAGADAGDAGPDGAVVEEGYAAVVLADKPLYYLPLDEEPNSSTVATLSKSYAHTKCSFGEPGLHKTCARLNGEDAFIELGLLASGVRKPMTFEAWVQIDGAIMGGQEGCPLTQGDGKNGFMLEVLPDKIVFERRLENEGTRVETGEALEPGKFHHVVATYADDKLQLYLDTTLVGRVPDSRAMPGTMDQTNVMIGSREGQLLFFRGLLDEVAVYDHALNAPAIAKHFAAGNRPPK